MPEDEIDILIREAKRSVAEAMYELSKKLMDENPDEETKRMSFNLLKKAAENGNSDAMYDLFNFYVDENDERNTFIWLERIVDKQDDAMAMIQLAESHFQGRGTPKNNEKGELWLKKAADPEPNGKNNKIAQHNLGLKYENGFDVIKNEKKGIKYYKLAAGPGQEYDEALHRLGGCYAFGIGIEKDLEKTTFYFKAATEQGYYLKEDNTGYRNKLRQTDREKLDSIIKWVTSKENDFYIGKYRNTNEITILKETLASLEKIYKFLGELSEIYIEDLRIIDLRLRYSILAEELSRLAYNFHFNE